MVCISLEQLFEREEELAQQKVLVENMESYLIEVKQQMTALYFDYAQKADEWEKREKVLNFVEYPCLGPLRSRAVWDRVWVDTKTCLYCKIGPEKGILSANRRAG